MTTVSIHGIQSADARAVWPVVERWVADACSYSDGLVDAPMVLADIEAGRRQLWVATLDGAPVAMAATQIEVYPSGVSVLCIPTVGGSQMGVWLGPFLDTLRRYAKEKGCTSMEGSGRRGWVRALKNHGWHERCVTVAIGV